ncbi:SARP family transcriptional regulator [Nonomuraea glycinis]|uniref:SARP family transcriptional regulator n=1 Tax=Nonomuraea glycinis TaxID=2047744 RepID=A0A918E2Z5_9ACTN|nr:SARP family transcriptional regulator [Nonomuraea glycinis]
MLGPLAVWTAAGEPVQVPEVKVRALLADLLVHRGVPVSTDRLTEDLWGGRPPGNAPAALRVKASQLRKALGDRDLVTFQPPGYLLRVAAEEVDAGLFQALLGRAAHTTDLTVRRALLTEALELWRGEAYGEFADEQFTRTAIAKLDEQRLVAMESLAETRLGLGEHDLLAAELADLVRRHPLRERLQAVHLRSLYRAGRQSEALTRYAALRSRLANDLGIDPGPELTSLHQAILHQSPTLTFPTPPTDPHPTGPRTNLPAPLTALVGRREAVAEVRSLLTTTRLITLTGPGGVGKTRLALEVATQPRELGVAGQPDAREVAGSGFAGGVWLVELGAVSVQGRGGVADAVAKVLGVRDDVPGALTDRLAGALRDGRTLLVLDNCEHVVDEVAELAGVLLRAAPGLRILATSQEPLRVAGETVWSVPPLARAAAVELFRARAGVRLDDDAAVAEICERLDGIPLALELAATRMRALTPRQLADRLDDRFRVLASGQRGAPARQRTLRAMIAWSWELLTEAERLVLRRLAVHTGGWTLEAAEAICADSGSDVVDVLTRLVDRSLVVAGPTRVAGQVVDRSVTEPAGLHDRPGAAPGLPGDRSGTGPRYRLLESVGAYCRERLAEAGELDAMRLRHARHYADLAERAEPHLRGHEQRRLLAVFDAEGDNIRAAIEASVRLGAAEEAVRLVNATAWYWVLRGRLGEGRRALESVVAVSDDVQARIWLTGLALLAGRPPQPDSHPLDSPEDPPVQGKTEQPHSPDDPPGQNKTRWFDGRWFEAVGEPLARARARWFAGFCLFGFDDLSASVRLIDEALADFQALGDTWGTAAALNVRARWAAMRGDVAALREDGERGLVLFRAAGDRWGEMRAAENLGTYAEITGDYERAAELRRAGLRRAEELGLWSAVSDALSRLGRIALLTGDHALAEDYHERARALAVSQSNRPAEEFAEVGLALVARRRGRLDEAERRMRAQLGWVREVSGDPGAALILAELGFAAEQRGDAAGALDLHLQSLASARKVGDPRAVALAFEGLAGARALRGRYDEAARLLGGAAALRESVGAPLPPAERGDVDRITAAVRQALGDDAFTAAMTAGATRPGGATAGHDFSEPGVEA